MNMYDMILPRIKSLPPSGIRKYFDMINEMKDVISLGIGEPDFVTPSVIRKAGIHSLEQGHTHYSSNAGFIELREEICRYMDSRFGLHYDPKEEVLVTVGGSEGIDAAFRALVGPGDEVIVPEPSFVAYRGCITFAGATPVIVDLRAEDDFKLTPELLLGALTEKTKVVVFPFPNNPTGSIMTRDEVAAIVEILRDRNVVVISDELYAELTYSGEHVSIASFPGMKEKTIVINGFSKAFAMTGWRIGFACGHPVIIDAMKKIHQYAIMCAPTTAQQAAIEALRSAHEDVKAMVAEYDRRRRLLVDGFRRLGLDCFEPLGAFYVFPCIKKTGLSADVFCEKFLLSERVLVVPGSAFGASGEGFIRACYASSYENIQEALVRLERFLGTIEGYNV